MSPLYRGGNQDTERLNNLPEVTQLSSRDGGQDRAQILKAEDLPWAREIPHPVGGVGSWGRCLCLQLGNENMSLQRLLKDEGYLHFLCQRSREAAENGKALKSY